MTNQADELKHFVVYKDGMIEDLYDVRWWHDSLEQTIKDRELIHGRIVNAATSPLGLFHKIVGVLKEGGKFTPIAANNWDKLFWLRGQFQYYLAYLENAQLVASSTNGIVWRFNVIDC